MPNLASIAALIGDPTRAAMLQALLPGEAVTAGELARVAGIGAAAASAQLKALGEAGLITVHAQGRHRYHRLAGEEIAAALETLIALPQASPRKSWPHGESFRQGRLCWHHLAGRLGVGLHERLTADGWIIAAPGGWALTTQGERRCTRLGVDLAAANRAPRFACDCMDLYAGSGGLGREITSMMLRRLWLTRTEPQATDTLQRRRLTCTPEGARALSAEFGMIL